MTCPFHLFQRSPHVSKGDAILWDSTHEQFVAFTKERAAAETKLVAAVLAEIEQQAKVYPFQ